MSKVNRVKKEDGLVNVITGLGMKGIDKKKSTSFKFEGKLSSEILDGIFRGSGIGRKTITRPAYDMIRNGWTFTNDTENSFQEIYKELKIKKYLKKSIIWDRLYGGSLLIIGVNDGGTLEDEINFNNAKNIMFLRSIEGCHVTVNENDIENDINNNNYKKPTYYTIKTGYLNDGYKVHYSRCIVFDGELTADKNKKLNGFGDSVFQHIYSDFMSLLNVYSNTETIIEDYVQSVFQMDNLQQLIATGKENVVKKRIEIMDYSRSILNSIMLGKGESYEKKTSSVGGLTNIIQEFQIQYSASAQIPVTLLFGKSPSGMNSTGESDFQNYYDLIEGLQEEKLTPAIEKINNILVNCSEYKLKNAGNIEYIPLKTQTQKEQAEIKKINSETDVTYLQYDILTREEIRNTRFKNGYSEVVNIDDNVSEIDNRGLNNPDEVIE